MNEYFVVERIRTYGCIGAYQNLLKGFIKADSPEDAMIPVIKNEDAWCLSEEHIRQGYIKESDVKTGDKLDKLEAYVDANAYHRNEKPIAILEGDKLADFVVKELERRKIARILMKRMRKKEKVK